MPYLSPVTERERAADAEALHEAVNARLRRDNLEEVGKLKREVASLFLPADATKVRRLKDKKCTKLSVTCLAVSADGRRAYSGSKDGGIVSWDLGDMSKLNRVQGGKRGQEEVHRGHCSAVNAIAVSSDGRFLVRKWIVFVLPPPFAVFASSSLLGYWRQQQAYPNLGSI